MEPANLTLTIHQGATFTREMTYRDAAEAIVLLASYTARMHIRASKDSTTTILELTTSNGRIALADTSPNLTLTISKTDTAALSGWTHAVYDLEVESGGGVVDRLLEGSVHLSLEVTR